MSEDVMHNNMRVYKETTGYGRWVMPVPHAWVIENLLLPPDVRITEQTQVRFMVADWERQIAEVQAAATGSGQG